MYVILASNNNSNEIKLILSKNDIKIRFESFCDWKSKDMHTQKV